MSNISTNYEKWYEGEGYYWGTEPADFCDELIRLCPPAPGKKVLDTIICEKILWAKRSR